jgi:uncharacterized protein
MDALVATTASVPASQIFLDNIGSLIFGRWPDLIFTGYGTGYAGAVGVVGGLLLACLIFLVQIGISTVWLQHFRFGPAEWLWRSLTYGTRQPMRLPRAAPALAPMP